MGIAVLAWLAVLGIVLWGLAHVVSSLLLFIVAATLAYALAPAVTHLERFMPRGLAITLVYLGILTTLSGLIYLIVITAIGQVSMLLADVQSLLAIGPDGQESPLLALFKSVGLSDQQVQRAGQQMLAQVQGLTGDAVSIAASVVDALVHTVLVGVLSIYLLKDGPKVVGWLRNNTPIAHRPRIVYFVDTLDTVVGGYIRGQLTLSALIGVLVGGGMWILHVPYAVFLGVLAFVLEFIPIVGVFISGGICVLLALTVGWLTAVGVLAYFVVVHFVEGDVIGPRIMSKAVGLHPALSILALLAGSELFGIWGALFAAPMAGLIQAVIRTIWLEWRESHPEQFPTGYTVTPEVRIIPVVHAETPPPATVEKDVTPEPAEPLGGDLGGSFAMDAEQPQGTPAETLAELAVAPVRPQMPDAIGLAGGASSAWSSLPAPAADRSAPDGFPTLDGLDGNDALYARDSSPSVAAAEPAGSPVLSDEHDLLPDVAAHAGQTPDPLASSIYERFGTPASLSPIGETDGVAIGDGDGNGHMPTGDATDPAPSTAAKGAAGDGVAQGVSTQP
jgi:predicted PurR-regulated permease PerM